VEVFFPDQSKKFNWTVYLFFFSNIFTSFCVKNGSVNILQLLTNFNERLRNQTPKVCDNIISISYNDIPLPRAGPPNLKHLEQTAFFTFSKKSQIFYKTKA